MPHFSAAFTHFATRNTCAISSSGPFASTSGAALSPFFKLRNSDSQRKKVYLKNYLSSPFSLYISVQFIIMLLSRAAPHRHRAKCCKCLCCPSRKRMRSYPGIDRSQTLELYHLQDVYSESPYTPLIYHNPQCITLYYNGTQGCPVKMDAGMHV